MKNPFPDVPPFRESNAAHKPNIQHVKKAAQLDSPGAKVLSGDYCAIIWQKS